MSNLLLIMNIYNLPSVKKENVAFLRWVIDIFENNVLLKTNIEPERRANVAKRVTIHTGTRFVKTQFLLSSKDSRK